MQPPWLHPVHEAEARSRHLATTFFSAGTSVAKALMTGRTAIRARRSPAGHVRPLNEGRNGLLETWLAPIKLPVLAGLIQCPGTEDACIPTANGCQDWCNAPETFHPSISRNARLMLSAVPSIASRRSYANRNECMGGHETRQDVGQRAVPSLCPKWTLLTVCIQLNFRTKRAPGTRHKVPNRGHERSKPLADLC